MKKKINTVCKLLALYSSATLEDAKITPFPIAVVLSRSISSLLKHKTTALHYSPLCRGVVKPQNRV
jgi:hypothetical protein